MVIGYILSFICGAFALGLAQFFLLWWFFTRSRPTKHSQPAIPPSFSLAADPNAPSRISIEGELWVASVSPFQIDCINKSSTVKVLKERKQKKEIEQITVLLSYAKLQDRHLVLTSSDGTSASIYLEGCTVVAVSSSTSPSRKWARKYPIKIEHTSRALLGTTVCLLYFKTGWEKETWCEALRAAARKAYGPEDWYSKIKAEFGEYVSELKNNFPEVFKVGSSSRRTRRSAPSTKKTISWKRLLKKKKNDAAKTKAVTVQTEDMRTEEATMASSSSYHDFENMSDANHSDTNPETSTGAGKSYLETAGSADIECHVTRLDGGVSSLNIMLSRIFFDLYHSSQFITVVHNRIQTLLSRIPTPGYISPITCSGIDIGKSCPFVHSLRPLPLSDDVFGVEADIEYNGGAVLTLETRLDMRESRAGDQKSQTSSAAAATTDIINKSLETVEDDLEVAGDTMPDQGSGSSKKKRWNQLKTFLSSVADQVSQVPLTLSMRVVSLKGTLQLRIKASPSDRIWYSFSSMPALELLPEPSVGDHKITTGPLLAYIAERIQILVYETMVYPNSEDIHIPWMLSDERNWAHQSAAPFPQVLAEPKFPEKPNGSKADHESGESVAVEGGAVSELERPLLDKRNDTEDRQQPPPPQQQQQQQPPQQQQQQQQQQLQQQPQQQPPERMEFNDDTGEPSNSSIDYRGTETGEDGKKKKGTRREKMLNLGKRFEEKTRLFAEKMRERFEKD